MRFSKITGRTRNTFLSSFSQTRAPRTHATWCSLGRGAARSSAGAARPGRERGCPLHIWARRHGAGKTNCTGTRARYAAVGTRIRTTMRRLGIANFRAPRGLATGAWAGRTFVSCTVPCQCPARALAPLTPRPCVRRQHRFSTAWKPLFLSFRICGRDARKRAAEMDPPVGGGEAGQARCRPQAGGSDDEDFQPDTKRGRGPGGTGSDSKRESRGFAPSRKRPAKKEEGSAGQGGAAGGQGGAGRVGRKESKGRGKDGGQGQGGAPKGSGGGGAVPLSQNTGVRCLPHQTTVIFLAPQHDGAWRASPDSTPGVAGELTLTVTTASVNPPRTLFSAHATYPAGVKTQTKQSCGVPQEKEQDGHYLLLGLGNGGDKAAFPSGFQGERP